MKTSANRQTLSNELGALIAATPLAVFLHAMLGDRRATRGAHASGMQASA